ncbi:hypothetical protein HG530_000463 [Fusarium avenaceum]|nr:hypothetical protein HG530_000463 [Fusarium avenaceum]
MELTSEGEDTTQQSNEPRKALCRPLAPVAPFGKDLGAVVVIAKDKKGDKNGEEADKMQNQDHALQDRKQRANNSVDNNGNQDTHPDHQSTMPRMRVVRGSRKDHETLDHSSSQESGSRRSALPSSKVHPACDITEVFRVSSRSEHGDPVVLASGHWRDGDEFAEGGERTQDADPDEEVAVDDTSTSAIVQARSEVHESSLPGDKNSTTEAQDRPTTEVSLREMLA